MISGHCECGRISYEIDGEITDYSHCHCGQCRRLHGAAFGSYGGVAKAGFRWVKGESELSIYASSANNDRHFCSHCGSLLMATTKPEPDVFYVTLGTMDGDPPRPPGYHIFVGSKAQWYEICDELPQFNEFSDDYP